MPLSHSIEHYFKPKMPTISLPPILGIIPTSHVLGHISTSQISLGQIPTSILGHFPTSRISLGQIPTSILGHFPTSVLGQIPI